MSRGVYIAPPWLQLNLNALRQELEVAALVLVNVWEEYWSYICSYSSGRVRGQESSIDLALKFLPGCFQLEEGKEGGR